MADEDCGIVLCESCGSEGHIQRVTHTYIDFTNGGIVECGWEEDATTAKALAAKSSKRSRSISMI
ncbi:MAG: hypothetical protein EOR25_29695 [Mesorhizobium sp.]|uniref:hypothetical protein n=1 Tax=Mesorhizobium sp. TaxID=1871066 RepID=UPI000FE3E91C|nr:hypothetical protein [Mesorhizobium sp.]RWJ04847.1 MAG: hypothetical protein EOR24_29660 [Mesorhizobium sp.]RWJ12001.1 MAG: hypothetical protein EOR25_29695 [Mesorhizobium sp.]